MVDMFTAKQSPNTHIEVFQSIRVIALHGYGPSHSMANMSTADKNLIVTVKTRWKHLDSIYLCNNVKRFCVSKNSLFNKCNAHKM